MRILSLFFMLFVFSSNIQSQWETKWFPSDLNIRPFISNVLEARTGFMFSPAEKRIRLDIGTSRDILLYSANRESVSFGVDLFTYTRLRSEGRFKFPVETIDYFFGFNGGYKSHSKKREIGIRFRLSHISTHLVDGNFNNVWKDGRNPFTYSREFIELIPYYSFSGLRIYSGLTYNFHVLPETISKAMYQVGFDFYQTTHSSQMVHPFIGYDFKLTGINDVYSGTSVIKAGIKFGYPLMNGFSILASFISGKSIHGMLFDLNESYFNLGFNLDI